MPNSHVEVQAPSMMVLGGEVVGRYIELEEVMRAESWSDGIHALISKPRELVLSLWQVNMQGVGWLGRSLEITQAGTLISNF